MLLRLPRLVRRALPVALAAAALAGCALLVSSSAPAEQSGDAADRTPLYLSLGDSLAAGSQPDATGRTAPTEEGYADVVGHRLGRVHPGLRTRKLSCGGARTGTLIAGGASCQPKGQPGQLVQAERLLAAHPNTVLVTIGIGDNDVEGCLSPGRFSVDEECVRAGMATIARDLPRIATRLKAAAGPHTAVVGVVDYDQFLAAWLQGPSGRTFARRSVQVVGAMNDLMARIYRQAGLSVADAGARFGFRDLATPSTARPGLPRAVERTCRLTWACDPPIGHDDHARRRGYQLIAETVLDALAGR